MRVKNYLILLFFVLLASKSFATHIVGGEIYYDCLGGNNYKITLKLYRDCFNGQVGYDDPVSIFIFDSLGNYVDSIQIHFPGSVVLPFPLNNPCLTPPTNICYEEAIYEGYISLPPIAGGYNLTYQRCCRNVTILNLINPNNVGSTYMAHIPTPGIAPCNSSPRFNHFPPIFLCAGVPLNFDHSATDLDGDSLHYQLCDPFDGLDVSPSCPILGPQTPSGCGSMASAPPAPFVPWLAPYNGSYPMSSSPALAVDPVTGLMTGTPNMVGQWVIGVCVEEYRNGQLISINKRDFQFNVVNCGIPVASIPTQQPFCLGSPSVFSQTSINAFSYHWDFGDTGLTNDTSNVFSPSWTYADTGTYSVSLIVNPGTLCSDTATIPVVVHPLPSMTNATTATICSGNSFSIPLSSSLTSTYTWVASNNPNTTGESITQQTGSPVSNTITNTSSSVQTVSYQVIPTSSPGGCAGPAQTISITVNPAPTMTNPPTANVCTGTALNISLTSNISANYSWQATNNDSTTGEDLTAHSGTPLSDTINNIATATQQVIYTVTPTSTANSCVGAAQTITVSVIPLPVMTTPPTQTLCTGIAMNVPLTSNVASSYVWLATNNTNTTGESTSNQSANTIADVILNSTLVNQNVVYSITPTSSVGSCIGTPVNLTATIHPAPTMTSPTTDTICSGDTASIALTSNLASTYTWIATDNSNTTGESLNSQTGTPLSNVITNTTSSVQNVNYTVTPTSTPNGCVGTPQTDTVTVNPTPVMTSANTANICTGIGFDIPLTSAVPSTYTWIAADNDSTFGEELTLHTTDTLADTVTSIAFTTQGVVYTITPVSNAGCPGSPQNVTVNIIPPPVVTTPATVATCSGIPLNLSLLSNVTSIYSWTGTDNPNTTGESITPQTGDTLNDLILNPTATDQTVAYTILPTSSPGGCPGLPFILTATIYHGITANFDFTKVPCVKQFAFADSSASAPVSWLWHFDDGDTSIAQNPSHVYDSAGVYNVQLISANANGCKDTIEIQVNIPAPTPVTVSSNSSVCVGNQIQLQATGGVAYTWSPAAGLNDSTIANPTASPDTTTTYNVAISTVDTFGDTCSQTLSTTVTAINPALYTINATADQDSIVLGNSTILHAITDTSLQVNWTPSTGMANPHDFDENVSPLESTTYIVSILDSAGCPKLDSVRIYVISNKCDHSSIFVPNTFTPNGDGHNDVLYARGNAIKELYFAVYNRRGELIFETYNPANGWDGNYMGKPADPDVFAWYLRAKCFNDGTLEAKGNVTIIR